MLPDEKETASYFDELGLTLECRVLNINRRATNVWSLRYGRRRVFHIGKHHEFRSLEKLWTDWYCEQPVLQHHYTCARMIAEASPDWSVEEAEQMERWLYQHRFGYDVRDHLTLSSNEECWPWTMMQARTPMQPLTVTGGPWLLVPEPPRLSPWSVTPALLAGASWRAHALTYGRYDLQRSGRFATALEELIGDAERLRLDSALDDAGGDGVQRRRL